MHNFMHIGKQRHLVANYALCVKIYTGIKNHIATKYIVPAHQAVYVVKISN